MEKVTDTDQYPQTDRERVAPQLGRSAATQELADASEATIVGQFVSDTELASFDPSTGSFDF